MAKCERAKGKMRMLSPMISMVPALLLGFGQAAKAEFEINLWPGEGRPVFEAVTIELPLRDQPQATAKVRDRVRVKKGQRVEFTDTVVRTITPGEFRALVDTTIVGRQLGQVARLSEDDYYSAKFPQVSVPVKKGDRIEFLQYRAEGSCFIRVQRNAIDAERCPGMDDQSFAIQSDAKVEWWIEASVGKAKGWLRVDTSSAVKMVRREF